MVDISMQIEKMRKLEDEHKNLHEYETDNVYVAMLILDRVQTLEREIHYYKSMIRHMLEND